MKLSILFSIISLVAGEIGTGAGPSQDVAIYQTANQHPNATGSVSLRGVNMTNIPDIASPVSWTASLNVTEVADIPGANGSVITNSVISLDSDGAFIANSSWDTCVIVMESVALNATVKGQKDNGNCSATFGDECVLAWTGAISLARAVAAASSNQRSGACGGMAFPQIPGACMGSLDSGFIATNITTTNNTSGGLFLYTTDELHDPANLTFYETAATRIWPILVVQSPSHDFEGGSGIISPSMRCLRAQNSTEGSTPIGDVPGVGSRFDFGVWKMSIVLMAMALVL
ncbi:uncharacterized protein LY89DRAFT_28129 [Mollisia scopiformis]|uniref:Uncharacterized protein n=1 Tax=Mollisia scopiformis TaxID=149040 RepID=A0A194XCG0_MOLSC|nr:uncharacterized protein LY89DRAFT_28129 [Mollisia scopiformis]KUJ17849.1 hypothetical protein LY89DRAFT_28129 [Mollisia scopiformis]